MKLIGSVTCLLFICVAAALGDEPAAKPSEAKPRVGTYDSRAIVAAYFFSPVYCAGEGKKAFELEAELKKAKAEGNEKRVAEAEAKLNDMVKTVMVPRHKQLFSTAPVEDILVHIKDQMREIAKTAGVDPIVSKWDKDALAKYKGAEFVDVTMAMVNAFRPTEKQLKLAREIQKQEPIPLEKADKIDWTKE